MEFVAAILEHFRNAWKRETAALTSNENMIKVERQATAANARGHAETSA